MGDYYMKTAEEMYDFCVKNGYGKGFNRKNSLKHFEIIQNTLLPDENVLCVFIGLHNYVSMSNHDNNFAYAITNKRIIMGQKKLIGEVSQIILLKNINDITFKSGLATGIITIDTIKETFNVSIEKKSAKNVYDIVHKTFYELKNTPKRHLHQNKSDSFQQIKELKELLDIGAITSDEFETKKKQLLGI